MLYDLRRADVRIKWLVTGLLATLGLSYVFGAVMVALYAGFTPQSVAATYAGPEMSMSMPPETTVVVQRPMSMADFAQPQVHTVDTNLLIQDTHVHVPMYGLIAAALGIVVAGLSLPRRWALGLIVLLFAAPWLDFAGMWLTKLASLRDCDPRRWVGDGRGLSHHRGVGRPPDVVVTRKELTDELVDSRGVGRRVAPHHSGGRAGQAPGRRAGSPPGSRRLLCPRGAPERSGCSSSARGRGLESRRRCARLLHGQGGVSGGWCARVRTRGHAPRADRSGGGIHPPGRRARRRRHEGN